MKRAIWLSLVSLYFLSLPLAEAALSVAPSRVVLKLKAGERETGFYTVQNRGDAKLSVKVQPVDWSYGIHGKRETVEWFTVDPKEFVLKPGEEAKVRYRVKTSKSDEGENRTQVFFISEPIGGESPLVTRLGTIVYVAIDGTERLEASITDVRVDSLNGVEEVEKPDKLRFHIDILNLGNAHVVPEGRVVIYDDEENRVEHIKLTGGWGLLPQETHTYQALKSGVYLKPGNYTAKIFIFYGGDLNRQREIETSVHFKVDETGHAERYTPEKTPEPPVNDGEPEPQIETE